MKNTIFEKNLAFSRTKTMSQNEYDNGQPEGFFLPSVLSYSVGSIPTERRTVIVVPSTTSLTAGSSSRCQWLFPQSGLLDFSNAELTMDCNYVLANASNYVALHTNPMSVIQIAEQDLGGQTLVVNDINIATNAYYKGVLDASALNNKAAYDVAGDAGALWTPSTTGGYVGDLVCNTANTRNNISRVIPLEMFGGVFSMNKYYPAYLAPQLRLTLGVANLASIGYEASTTAGAYAASLSSATIQNFRLRVPQIQLPAAVSQAIQMAAQQGLMARSNFARVYSKAVSSNGESLIINTSARAGCDGVVFGLVKATTDNPYSARLGTATSAQYRVRVDGQDVVSQALDNRELLNSLCNFLQKPFTADCALAFRGKQGYVGSNGWGGIAFEMSNTRIPQEMLTGYTSGQNVQIELIAENTGDDGSAITGTLYMIVDTAILYNFSQAGVSMVY